MGLAIGLTAGFVLFGTPGGVEHRTVQVPVASAEERSFGSSGVQPAHESIGAPASASGEEGRANAAQAPRPSEEREIRRLLLEGYREQVPGGSPEPDLFEAAVDELLRATREFRELRGRNLGRQLKYRQTTRAELGELEGSTILLQVSAPGTSTANPVRRSTVDTPLQISGPPTGADAAYATNGMVPPGRVFVIERMHLRAFLPEGRVEVRLPLGDGLSFRSVPELDITLRGLVLLRHGSEARLQLRAGRAAAQLEVHGRLVSAADAESLVQAQPVMAGEDGTGFLTGAPVLLQVLADHGGGNPRTVRLDGSLYRIDALLPESIWTEQPRLRARRGSMAHYRGAGQVPPGKAFRITRAWYRALLDPEWSVDRHLVLKIGPHRVETAAADKLPDGTLRVEGMWEGDIRIPPGKESEVSLTCSYYALAEVTLYGELVDG